MKRREIWGIALLVTAALCAWAYHFINGAYRSAAREGLLLYVGIPGHSIASWFLVVAFLSGAAGLSLLLPALIGRIPRKIPRRIVGWITGMAAAAAAPYFGLMFLFAALGAFGIGDTVKIVAADGTSVLVSQDWFDGDSVVIYTEHDEFHYKRVRDAPEISRGPRVKDQDCQLDSADGELQLLCGDQRLMVAVGP
ncbi:hypothetical protein AU252_20325 [Pseudarthrobacter sulfonivorans]|uniref:Uncharacterized protein n=1 Tax=Pseudarthrobacter sulfonivorans TaxID=121292 RepID=A0A0U3PCI1_9MICC|nr:hypothetical protein [Pseudarthrobacter sulfonivorans]ALV43216.1 hypothetical protein AU252_20325 [Pseudarthrobacter sulfonivorans]